MPSTIIKNATVVSLERLLTDHTVFITDGVIAGIVPKNEVEVTHEDRTHEDRVVDAQGHYLVPGYIDLHVHGTGTHLVDNGPEALSALSCLLPRYGVTGFLPTVAPLAKGEDAEFIRSLSQAPCKGTAMLGFHLEGPFLTLTGALPPEAIGVADPDRLEALIAAAHPNRAIFSVSPDFVGILDLLPAMIRSGGVAFMTHTAASVEQAQAAIDAGVRHATHFYDVFPAPPEVDPGVRHAGVMEAVLADDRVSVDFILDGVHVHPVVVQMALQCKGPDRVCLITDANVGAGMAPGEYQFGREKVVFEREGGPARLAKQSRMPGGLAGSGLTMDRTVRNAVNMLRLPLPLAVRMASANPARVLGIDSRKGQIAEGYDADIVMLDQNLEVVRTWISGNSVFASCESGPGE